MRRVAGLALVLALACAARADEGPGTPVAPGVRGALVLEPGRIRAGDVADLEIVVVTPPDHTLRPVAPPASLPGFWILGAEPLPVEKGDGRWIHRTRVKLRARDLGQFVWPGQPVEIEGPDGSVQRLVLEGRPLEVVSVQPEFPGRSAPFGLREPPLPPGTGPLGPAAAAAAGFLLGVASLAAVTRLRHARRRREGRARTRTAEAPGPAPEALARQALAAAGLRAAAAPADAADAAAGALRRLASARLGDDLTALTTPEIAARIPPRGGADAFRTLARTLEALDEARFAPAAPETFARLRAAVAAAVALGAAWDAEQGP